MAANPFYYTRRHSNQILAADVLARLREDESDRRRNMIERGIDEAMQRFFSKFHREQDDDDE